MGCGASSKPAASGPKVMVVSQPQPQVAVAPTPQYSAYYEQAKAAFTGGDVDRSGALDVQELYQVLCRLGFFNGVDPTTVNTMLEAELQKADLDRGRTITFDEFVPYFEFLMKQLQSRGATVMPPAQPQQYYGQQGYGVAPVPQAQGYGYAQQPQPGQRGGGGSGVGTAAAVGAGVVGAGVVGGLAYHNRDAIGGAASAAGGAAVSGAGAAAAWAPGAASAAGGAVVSGAGAVASWAPGAASSLASFAGDAIGALASFF